MFTNLLNNSVYISILAYLFTIIIILKLKPSLFFKKNGKMKETGCGNEKTIFSFPMFLVINSILMYFIIKYFY